MARKRRWKQYRNDDSTNDATQPRNTTQDHALDEPPAKKQQLNPTTGDLQAITTQQLPAGVSHPTHISDVPFDLQNYFRQRHSLFSLYSSGIWMTDSAWYGVTPESIATKIATHAADAAPQGRSIILDAFAGVGGNTIAFALSGRWKRVYAIEKDPVTLACAKHNAEVYGVSERITWFEGDVFEVLGVGDGGGDGAAVGELREMIKRFGVIFASPPWGGPGYKSDEVFDLKGMKPYALDELWGRLRSVCGCLALYLPRTSDLRQVAACVKEEHGKGQAKINVVHYCTRGWSRALCAYLGEWKRLKA